MKTLLKQILPSCVSIACIEIKNSIEICSLIQAQHDLIENKRQKFLQCYFNSAIVGNNFHFVRFKSVDANSIKNAFRVDRCEQISGLCGCQLRVNNILSNKHCVVYQHQY